MKSKKIPCSILYNQSSIEKGRSLSRYFSLKFDRHTLRVKIAQLCRKEFDKNERRAKQLFRSFKHRENILGTGKENRPPHSVKKTEKKNITKSTNLQIFFALTLSH